MAKGCAAKGEHRIYVRLIWWTTALGAKLWLLISIMIRSGSLPTSMPPGVSRSSGMCMIGLPIGLTRSRPAPFSILVAAMALWPA